MANYTLNIAFTAEQLTALNASGMSIVLGKSFQGGTPQVAWQVFKPLASNTIQWNDDYSVYYSKNEPKPGTVIKIKARAEGARGGRFKLNDNGYITTELDSSNTYSFDNGSASQFVTGGLCQDGTVNGTNNSENIVCGELIFQGNRLTIRPGMKLSIWLQPGISEGTVLGSIGEPVTELDFAGSKTISVKYDSNSKKFVG
jgi:hypothetical protein